MVLQFLWESMSSPDSYVPDQLRDETPDSPPGFFITPTLHTIIIPYFVIFEPG